MAKPKVSEDFQEAMASMGKAKGGGKKGKKSKLAKPC